VKLDAHYVDPRLVALYDLENPRGDDTDYWLSLAADVAARTIVDVGCGTGLLTCALAVDGRVVSGVDPSTAMLEVARRRPGADRVRWVVGDATALTDPALIAPGTADLVVMTGNVAQVFLGDEDWGAALHAAHTALRPGGRVAFESRNPEDRAWERWDPERTAGRVVGPDGPVRSWLEVLAVADARVRFRAHNVFEATGEDVVSDSELRFRSAAELRGSLHAAGFEVEHVYGDWRRSELAPSSRVMVVVARRPGAVAM
jgi:SAM-dependent methyltransferase